MKKTLSAAAIALLTLTACSTVDPNATYESGADLAKAINTVDDFGCDTDRQKST